MCNLIVVPHRYCSVYHIGTYRDSMTTKFLNLRDSLGLVLGPMLTDVEDSNIISMRKISIFHQSAEDYYYYY